MGDVARALGLSVVTVSDAEREKGAGLFDLVEGIRARGERPLVARGLACRGAAMTARVRSVPQAPRVGMTHARPIPAGEP